MPERATTREARAHDRRRWPRASRRALGLFPIAAPLLALGAACTAVIGFPDVPTPDNLGDASSKDALVAHVEAHAPPLDAAGDVGPAPHDASADAPCTTGEVDCLGALPRTCLGGVWLGNSGGACSDASGVCLHGACVACTPGAVQCAGPAPQECSDAGAWQSHGAPCDASSTCLGGACVGVCGPGEAMCNGETPETCTATGEWQAVDGGACATGAPCCGGTCKTDDSDNCGACGIVCNGSCTSGACLVTLATGQNDPENLVVVGNEVYWVTLTNPGTVVKVPADGGASVTLATAVEQAQGPYALAVAGSSVYWVDLDDNTIDKVAIDGGATTTIASGLEYTGLVIDSDTLFATSGDSSGLITRQLLSGGARTTIATAQDDPWSIGIEGAHVYWVDLVPAGSIVKAGLDGGAPVTLAAADNSYGFAVDSTGVYWANDTASGSVLRVGLDGGALLTLATEQAGPYSLTVDGTNVYWTTETTVVKAPVSGEGPVVTLATGQAEPSAIVVDATSVYWATFTGGTILKRTPK
jgi:sugar lactone lactonase YvrE